VRNARISNLTPVYPVILSICLFLAFLGVLGLHCLPCVMGFSIYCIGVECLPREMPFLFHRGEANFTGVSLAVERMSNIFIFLDRKIYCGYNNYNGK